MNAKGVTKREMKLLEGNPNYAATVVTVRNIVTLSNCYNVVALPLLGYQAIVSKDVQVGDIGVLFTAETQLSEEYAAANNLHRHGNLNVDPSTVGYLEDNRRVKALRFRGHTSNALFLPIDSLSYLGSEYASLKDGDSFDQLAGHEICRKYVRPNQKGSAQTQGRRRKEERVDERFFPKHTDTENYFKNVHKLNDSDFLTITQKLHGTSIRVGHIPVKRKLSFWERVSKKFGAKIDEFEYDYVYGSRNVVKDANSDHHFYSEDLWTQEGKKLEGLLPKGYIVYGELIGWVGSDTPIQKDYTYGIPKGERHLYVYRVTTMGIDGRQTDLSWEATKEFCSNVGLKTVPELTHGYLMNMNIERLMDRLLFLDYEGALPLPNGSVDEGVCIRREGLTPLVLKAKSPKFLEHETKMIDKEVEDIESDETEES